MNKPRIILDRSAFHPHHFELLQDSPLLRLSREHRVSVYHTATFIEETASLYLKESNRPLLRRQLPFILEICNSRWLRPTDVVWIKEVFESAGEKESVFLPANERKHMESLLWRMVSEEWLDAEDLEAIRKDKDQVKQRATRLRRTFVKMRQKVDRGRREGVKGSLPSFEDFLSAKLEDFGREILSRHLQSEREEEAANKWARQPDRFPYFTAFATGLLFAAYHAMAHPGRRIDVNAQMDVEQLSYLHGVDVLVSNDFRFMKDAFDVLWAPRGKRFFGTAEMIKYLGSL